MHPNAELLRSFYSSFASRDAGGMAACYHPAVKFSDEVFVDLQEARAAGMWRMLCERGKDLRIEFRDIEADDSTGRAHWEGKIIRHRDTFDFWAWARQALGPIGALLGWSTLLRNRVRSQAAANLTAFLSRRGERS